MKIRYKVEVIADHSYSEIDFDLYEDLFPEEYKKDEFFDDLDSEDNSLADSYPIQIDRMIQKLQELKDKGCNYVNIDYHCDHIGYNIEGLKITKIEE